MKDPGLMNSIVGMGSHRKSHFHHEGQNCWPGKDRTKGECHQYSYGSLVDQGSKRKELLN